jgi:hypothetical protein
MFFEPSICYYGSTYTLFAGRHRRYLFGYISSQQPHLCSTILIACAPCSIQTVLKSCPLLCNNRRQRPWALPQHSTYLLLFPNFTILTPLASVPMHTLPYPGLAFLRSVFLRPDRHRKARAPGHPPRRKPSRFS